jgi:hypothetical protein
MKEPKFETFSVDIMLDEIIVERSAPLTPRPPDPVLSAEEQALADAVRRYQNEHRRALLNWRDIFEIVQALGYRKIEQSPKPSQSNGSPQDPARPDAAGNETPS